MPAFLQRLGLAVAEYERYASELLERERKISRETSSGSPRNSLLSQLVRVADSEQPEGAAKRSGQTLSDQEILGNIFVFNIAGHDVRFETTREKIES